MDSKIKQFIKNELNGIIMDKRFYEWAESDSDQIEIQSNDPSTAFDAMARLNKSGFFRASYSETTTCGGHETFAKINVSKKKGGDLIW